MGSRENLKSPMSPTDTALPDWGPPGSSRKSSLATESIASHRRLSEAPDAQQQQTTTEMFKDMLSQKRNMFLSKLSSFDSEVSSIVSIVVYPRVWYIYTYSHPVVDPARGIYLNAPCVRVRVCVCVESFLCKICYVIYTIIIIINVCDVCVSAFYEKFTITTNMGDTKTSYRDRFESMTKIIYL